MTDQSISAALKVLLSSDTGKQLLDYAAQQIAEQNSITAKTQAGQAGAVPQPDTAPLTGAPKADANTVINPPGMTQDAPFHWINNQTMADIANEQMRDAHGANGTSYDNKER